MKATPIKPKGIPKAAPSASVTAPVVPFAGLNPKGQGAFRHQAKIKARYLGTNGRGAP